MGQGDMNGQAIDRFIHLEHAWGQKLNLAIVNRRIETKPSEKITDKNADMLLRNLSKDY